MDLSVGLSTSKPWSTKGPMQPEETPRSSFRYAFVEKGGQEEGTKHPMQPEETLRSSFRHVGCRGASGVFVWGSGEGSGGVTQAVENKGPMQGQKVS